MTATCRANRYSGSTPVAEALFFIDSVLQGVQAIHAAGLVHRDIKPDNILLMRDGLGALMPKVADLGIVHTVDGTRLTADGSQLGTLEYMAPELFDTHEPSAQSDIYACGILLYELLVGEAPFTGSQVQIMRGQCMVPPDLERLPAEVPACVRKALEKALAKKPEARFSDCAIFREALGDHIETAATRRRVSGGSSPRRSAQHGKETEEAKTLLMTSGSDDRTIRLWNAHNGQTLHTLTGHQWAVNSVTFAPDGQTIASGSDDKTIRLWNAGDGRHLRTLEGHTGLVRSVAYSPDGQTIASGSDDKTIRLWEARTGRPLGTLRGHWGPVSSVQFAPDSQTIASGSSDNTIRLWNASDGQTSRTFKGHTSSVWSVMFSPDGGVIASGSRDKTIRLWYVGDGDSMRTLEGHSDWVRSVTFSPDGQTIASSTDDNTVRLWSASDGVQLRVLKGHSNWVYAVTFDLDGRLIASGSADNTIRLWNASDGRPLRTFEGHTDPVNSVSFWQG